LQAIIAQVEANHDVWFGDGDLVEEIIFALQKENPHDAKSQAQEKCATSALFMDQKFIRNI
tara:strand:- start:6913 stop:7095 length:183 start_codon:yes stop_codon:yes gene_type:complete